MCSTKNSCMRFVHVLPVSRDPNHEPICSWSATQWHKCGADSEGDGNICAGHARLHWGLPWTEQLL